MNRNELQGKLDAGEQVEWLFFWGHTPKEEGAVGPWCFSQWYPATFVVDGERYASAEHYMMAGKASLFGDGETRARILAAPDPGAAKKLGRQVSGFVESTWNAHRFDIVVAGNVAKFEQNPKLKSYLLDTSDRVLVEAAPRDTIWGIGLGAKNDRARNPAQWRGLNLLGFALMEAREQLRRR